MLYNMKKQCLFNFKNDVCAWRPIKDMQELQSFFPSIKEYGGYLKDINSLKKILNSFGYKISINTMGIELFYSTITSGFTNEMKEYLKNAINLYNEIDTEHRLVYNMSTGEKYDVFKRTLKVLEQNG